VRWHRDNAGDAYRDGGGLIVPAAGSSATGPIARARDILSDLGYTRELEVGVFVVAVRRERPDEDPTVVG
jgi:hypothetical protein